MPRYAHTMITANARLLRAGSAVFAALALWATLPQGSRAENVSTPGPSLAYDEIVRLLPKATPPPPDSFAEDAARIAALPPLPDTKRVNGAIDAMNAIGSNPLLMMSGVGQFMIMAEAGAVNAYNQEMQAAGAAYRTAGFIRHVYLYHGWSRVDTPRHAVIVKPEQGLRAYLNLATHTYSETRTPPAAATVATYSLDDNPASVEYSAGPTIRKLAPMTIAGQRARGYQTDATFSLSATLGLCSPGRHEMRELEYVADITDPEAAKATPMPMGQAAKQACVPAPPGSHNEPGHLVLFRSTDISAVSGTDNYVIVLERSNVRMLGVNPAGLFSIPPDFSKEQSP